MIDLNPNRINYYKQTNNKLDPINACQSTMAAQCIDIIGEISNIKGMYEQPEDNIRAYCASSDMLKYCVLSHGLDWNKQVDHPAEWADVLVKAINEMLGYKCATFIDYLSWEKVIKFLDNKQPVGASMRYAKIPGHYVSVVGYTDRSELIIDDPYKNDLVDSTDGYHNIYTKGDWTAHSKNYGIVFSRRA